MNPQEEGRELPASTQCPKCGAPRDLVACPKCGLAADHMAAYRRNQDNVPEVLEKAWQRALETWTDDACHDEVMRLVTQHDAYAWAAAQYRRRPADAIRDRQLERVRKSTEAPMLIAAAAKLGKQGPTPYKAHMILLVLMVVAALAALLFTAILPKGEDDASPPQGGEKR